MKKTTKKILSFIAASTIAVSMLPQAMAAQDDVKIMIKGTELLIEEGDTKPFVENERTYVPMRAIFEALGAKIDWDAATQTIKAHDDAQKIDIVMQVGKDVFTVNGAEVKTDAPSKIVNERTVVPVRVIAEGLNKTVDWDANTSTVYITDKTTETAKPDETVKPAIGEIHSSIQHITDSPDWVKNLPSAQDENTKQLFVVAGMGLDKTTASVSMHERDENGNWKQVLSTPGYVGKNGLCSDKEHKEGCGQTPIGIYKFNKAFGIADDPGCAMEYTKVTNDIYWSGDDKEGMRYNEMVDIKDYPNLDMKNSEHITDYEYQYQYCLNISFNEEGTPGRGSAIFLHCLGPAKPYTGGCVAMPENIMKMVMQKVTEDCVVVIDTLDNLGGSL